jgi:hypothetical protein
VLLLLLLPVVVQPAKPNTAAPAKPVAITTRRVGNLGSLNSMQTF